MCRRRCPQSQGKRSRKSIENPNENILRCGRWVLRQTKVRLSREVEKSFPPDTQVLSKKRKHPASPTSSEHSFVGENSVPVARMADDLSDIGMWGYSTVETFINIMLDEVRKEGETISKRDRNFTSRQWTSIEGEMARRLKKRGYTIKKLQGKFQRLKKSYNAFKDLKTRQTGLGWDESTETVTMSDNEWRLYIQAHPDAKSFRKKGLDHYDLLVELLGNSMATGAFALPSTLGAPTSDDEREMEEVMFRLGKGKGLGSSTNSGSKGKRKSDDGRSYSRSYSSKAVKKECAYDQIAFCQRARGEWYQSVKAQNTQVDASSTTTKSIELLNVLKDVVEPSQFVKAFSKLSESNQLRESFCALDPEMRRVWVNSLP